MQRCMCLPDVQFPIALRPSFTPKILTLNISPLPFKPLLQLAQKYLKAFKEFNEMREEVLKAKWGQR